MQDIFKNIPSNWDIILLGRINIETDTKDKYLIMHKFWGTHGYLITKNGASKCYHLEEYQSMIR
jgi:hypothetical protein